MPRAFGHCPDGHSTATDFMVSFFEEKKLAVGSIENYKSAIANSLNYTQLIQILPQGQTPLLRTTPEWNLALVLDTLSKPPFEPLQSIELANLSVKPSSWQPLPVEEGERASCLLLQGLWHDKQQKSVYLLFDRSFLAKTQRIHHRVQTALNIPALPYDEQEERYLCPIR